jgi:hypothetical protein
MTASPLEKACRSAEEAQDQARCGSAGRGASLQREWLPQGVARRRGRAAQHHQTETDDLPAGGLGGRTMEDEVEAAATFMRKVAADDGLWPRVGFMSCNCDMAKSKTAVPPLIAGPLPVLNAVSRTAGAARRLEVHENVHELAKRIAHKEPADAPRFLGWPILDGIPPLFQAERTAAEVVAGRDPDAWPTPKEAPEFYS